MAKSAKTARTRAPKWVALTAMAVLGMGFSAAQNMTDSLRSGFENPPESARPRVWWHWMNGNITQEGIKLDLEWMHRIGLGGFQNFDADLGTPQVVEHRLAYMTPDWKKAFLYATTKADQLGLEEAIAGSPGWSETGGPWVPASQGMKKYVWSETRIEGGKPFTGVLAPPPSNTGAFQDLPVHDLIPQPQGWQREPQFYADSVVIAYRIPADETTVHTPHPKMSFSGGSPEVAHLTDGDLQTVARLPIPADGSAAWIQYEYPAPQRIQSLTFAQIMRSPFPGMIGGNGQSRQVLEASEDGVTFRTVVEIPENGALQHTLSFAPVTAHFFRMVFRPLPPLPAVIGDIDPRIFGVKLPPPATDYVIAELALHPAPRVNRFEEKAAFATLLDLYSLATPKIASQEAIPKGDVVDLTAKMQPGGKLDWTPPAGEWMVLRFGYSLLGITNHPASAEGTGLEVDKLNRAFVKNYMDRYLDNYKSAVGSNLMGARGVKYVVTDSWEAGSQNWTDAMVAEFTARRGYNPLPWMPVLTGHIVESAAASDRFLWDFRKTIADLTADEHYGQVEASIKERGMGHYGESHEGGRAFIADGMEVKKLDDVPMSAMWTQYPGVNKEQYGPEADVRESASVAHIYGQNLVAAESMTAIRAPWMWSPETLKPTADMELAAGVNRYVIHCSVHQPLVNEAPGLGLGPFGQMFTRNETWAEEAAPWIRYLARGSYMLQQGRFSADILYFYGEDSNLTAIFGEKAPQVPEGYDFDYVNADALIHELKVKDGRIVTPSGMSYRVLFLDPYSRHMSLPVLRKLHQLVEDGAIVVGDRAVSTPSLADNAREFSLLAEEVWGDGVSEHSLGRGRVFPRTPLVEVLQGMGVERDFAHTPMKGDARLLFVHRKLVDGDLYYIDNRSDQEQQVDATFRIAGKAAELWHADTGVTEDTSYRIAAGRTTVPLQLEAWGTVFVVFRKPAVRDAYTAPHKVESELVTIEKPWTIRFPPGRGAPVSLRMEKLISWSDVAEGGVKYFSGTGTYSNAVELPAGAFQAGTHLWIDLGEVKNLADVTVNGKPLGILWHSPYRVDATAALRPGKNELTIKVTNAWVNRLIGDQQPGATEKYTFSVFHPYTADSPLLTSGLLGPVRILSVQSIH